MSKRSRAKMEAGDSLAKRIVFARRAASLSRTELAKAVGVDPSTVTGWENGEYRPREGAQRKKLARPSASTSPSSPARVRNPPPRPTRSSSSTRSTAFPNA